MADILKLTTGPVIIARCRKMLEDDEGRKYQCFGHQTIRLSWPIRMRIRGGERYKVKANLSCKCAAPLYFTVEK